MTFTFDVKGNRELPHIMGQLTILPKHWWEGKDASGKQRNIADPPWSRHSGRVPTRLAVWKQAAISNMSAPRSIGQRTTNTEIGKNNFDTVRYDLYGDENCHDRGFQG